MRAGNEMTPSERQAVYLMSQSVLLSTQLCSLVEIVSAIEKAEVRDSIGKIPMPESLRKHLQKSDHARQHPDQLSLECQYHRVFEGYVTGRPCSHPEILKFGCKGRLDCTDFMPQQREDSFEIDNCPAARHSPSCYTLYHDPDPARYRTGPKRDPILDDPRNRASMRKLWHLRTSPDGDLIMKKPDEEPSCAFDPDKDGFCERYCGPCIAIKEKQPQRAFGSFKEAKPNV